MTMYARVVFRHATSRGALFRKCPWISTDVCRMLLWSWQWVPTRGVPRNCQENHSRPPASSFINRCNCLCPVKPLDDFLIGTARAIARNNFTDHFSGPRTAIDRELVWQNINSWAECTLHAPNAWHIAGASTIHTHACAAGAYFYWISILLFVVCTPECDWNVLLRSWTIYCQKLLWRQQAGGRVRRWSITIDGGSAHMHANGRRMNSRSHGPCMRRSPWHPCTCRRTSHSLQDQTER